MPSLFDKIYRFRRSTPLVDSEFNTRFRSHDDRLLSLEDRRFSEDVVLTTVQDRVLTRSEAVIAGLRDRLVAITQLQWLTGNSGTPRTLAADTEVSFVIEEADRVLFAPGPYAVVSSAADPTGYAIVRTIGYSAEVGQYDCHVEVLSGLAGLRSDWTLAAVAGSTLAQRALLDQGKSALAGAQDARTAAQGSATAAAGSAAASAADRVRTGQDRTATGSDRAATQTARDQAVAAAGTVDTSKFLQLDGLRQLTGKLLLVASSAARAALNLPAGTDPSAPAEGDVWYVGSGVLRAFVAGAVHRIPFLGLDQSWGGVQTFLRPVRLTQGATSASPADGDVRVASFGLLVRFGGAERVMATAAEVAAQADASATREFYGPFYGYGAR